jgi:thiol-disulfide isomerase/thioredoxin
MKTPSPMKPSLFRYVCWLALAAGLSQPARAAGLKPGQPFPDLKQFSLEGALPASIEGKVVLIDFWASWCPPCRASFPVMADLHQRYGERGLIIIAISVDEQRAKLEAFLKKTPAPFAVVRDATQKLVAAADAETMPTSFLLDREGRIRFRHQGFKPGETAKEYEREIEELLKASQ